MSDAKKENPMPISDGGPAFPTQNTSAPYCGLSRLDYFAEGAMRGSIHGNQLANSPAAADHQKFAAWCYDIARAMLAESDRVTKGSA